MSNFAIIRIVGNELPPRDACKSRIKSLKLILEQEKIEAKKIWILNRILDKTYREEVISILSDQEIYEIPFNYREFKKAETFEQKILSSININQARNYALTIGNTYNFSAILDEDCFFFPEDWLNITKFISRNPASYYACITKRLSVISLEASRQEPDEEPMLIFKNDSTTKFNEALPFGQDDKRELLKRLGWKLNSRLHEFKTDLNICPKAGYVMHIAHGSRKHEIDINYRIQQRRESLNLLIDSIEKKIRGIKFI